MCINITHHLPAHNGPETVCANKDIARRGSVVCKSERDGTVDGIGVGHEAFPEANACTGDVADEDSDEVRAMDGPGV